MANVYPRYFTLAELTRTTVTALNIPEWAEVSNLQRLAYFLDTVRAKFAKPIKVNSGFRSRDVNARVGGSATSAHLRGLAADICAQSGSDIDNRRLLEIINGYMSSIDQLIVYHKAAGNSSTPIRFIHVGLSLGSPRCQKILK